VPGYVLLQSVTEVSLYAHGTERVVPGYVLLQSVTEVSLYAHGTERVVPGYGGGMSSAKAQLQSDTKVGVSGVGVCSLGLRYRVEE
jgi:enoyl-[acyl-carrier-protein] reductase (NADH)